MLTLQFHVSNFIIQSEKIRWGLSIKSFETQEKTLCGDVLLTAAFVSYIGPFTKQYRQELLDCKWVPFLQQKVNSIPHLVNVSI
jgi:dynein heavy chain